MPYRAARIDRFWAMAMPEPNSGCWLWMGNCIRSGYGRFGNRTRNKAQNILAHRLAWEFARGTIPTGMLVLHKCDVPLCVNPDHLFLGTGQDNMTDKCRKGRHRNGGARTARLTEHDVRAIRADDRTHQEIADVFGVSQTHITNIKNGKRRTHVAEEVV